MPRVRTPTKLKLLRGNPGHRPLPENEPEFSAEVPPCPQWMGRVAKAEWRRIVKELDPQGLITPAYRAMLVGYCELYEELRRLTLVVQEEGQFYASESGVKREHPAAKARRDCLQRLNTYQALFGLSPADSSKVSAKPQKRESQLEKLLKKRGDG